MKREPLTPFVESYRLWDVVVLWARDRLEHEEIVARALARGVICDGLKAQSIDPRWLSTGTRGVEFRGYPYVGYRAKPESEMCVLRADALEHLLAIVRKAEEPDPDKLREEFIVREDFRSWACSHELKLPTFWFGTVVSRGV
jgi:hypothetical protein